MGVPLNALSVKKSKIAGVECVAVWLTGRGRMELERYDYFALHALFTPTTHTCDAIHSFFVVFVYLHFRLLCGPPP